MEVGGGGGREIIYLSLHSNYQNDACIKIGNDASQFNVSLIIVRDKRSHKTVSRGHNLLKREESRSGIEPWSFCLPA